MPDTLKIVFVPWGSSDYGDDVWLIENAAVFTLQLVLDILQPVGSAQHADLYSQLGGDKVKTTPIASYTEAQLRQLAAKAPADVDAIVDGMLTVRRSPDTDAMISVEIAPLILLIREDRIELPDAFIFESFTEHRSGREKSVVADPLAFFETIAALADAIIAPLGIDMPPHIDGERLMITPNWDAFVSFVKAKRLARTSEEKRGYYRQALRSDPDFYLALFNEGQILKGQRDFAGARRYFMDAIKAAHADPSLLGETYFEIGLCSVSLGDPKTARNFWDQALIYAPNNSALLVNIAGTYEQEEKFEKAIEIHRQALALDQNYHKALVSIGRLAAALGDLNEAIDCYERALQLQPNDALRHAILGGCYLANDQRELARKYLHEASRLDPPRAKLAPVTGSDPLDDVPVPGEYARQELAKLDEFDRAKNRRR